ncbi:hypothetical protein [Acaryochloris sp. IP29b_bin.137]|uniref:hypothetical protein n=1 Tax=Acaryochloris sp. IP29b_bin.137 TaxID=2969217 RepID=UPI002611DFCE|nr:hypothetical protein [Acaryochloris sp. IP29b_bin.137]
MNSNRLRQVWEVIETTQTDVLTQLNDKQLVQVLLTNLKERNLLPTSEEANTKAYLQSRLLLIRELAQSRKELCCPLKVKVAIHPPLEVLTRDLIAG